MTKDSDPPSKRQKISNNPEKLLLDSTLSGNLEGVQQAIIEKADINFKDDTKNTALHIAAFKGYTEIVELLLANGANVNDKDIIGETPFHFAIERGNTEIVKILLEKGADINVITKYGLDTALHFAAKNGSIDITNLLLTNGADINARNEHGYTALHIAAFKGYTEIVKILIKNRADINALNAHKQTALDSAADKGHIEIVKILIKNRADINLGTAMHYATSSGHTEIVKLLLEKGADIDAQDLFNETALHRAVSNNKKEIVKILLEKGADINAINQRGHTALHIAAELGRTEILNILSKASDINRLLKENFAQNPQEKTRLIGQLNNLLNPAPNETDDAKKERESIIKSLAGFAACVVFSNDNLKQEFLACFDNKTGKLDERKYTEFFDKYFPGIEPRFKEQLQFNLLAKYAAEKIELENTASTGIPVNLDKALGLLTSDIITIIGSDRVNDLVINIIKTGMKRAIAKAAVSGMPLKDANTNIVLPPEIGLIIGSLIPLNAQNLGDLPGVNKDASVNARDEIEAYLNKVKNILTDLKNPDGSRVFPDNSPVINFIDEQLKNVEEAKKPKETSQISKPQAPSPSHAGLAAPPPSSFAAGVNTGVNNSGQGRE